MEATSMTMMSTIPNIITSSPSGGRFDFDDGGTYCGGWQDGKAHGHGVCTGPKNVGEYSGSWNFGFEMSGVYKWTNGAVYEGRWQNGKRHGVGVEYNGKWIYKGEWSQGLKGRYGVKASSNSAVKYEGTWANGLQDGYGSETYSDGGYYQGQMCRGLRHGYGVRKSAPYGDSQLNNPSKNGPLTGGPSSSSSTKHLLHSNSMQSSGSATDLSPSGAFGGGGGGGLGDDDSPKPEDGFKPNIDRTLVSKNGFVLVAKPLDVPMPQSNSGNGKLLGVDTGGKRRSSLTKLAHSTRIPNQTSSLLRGLRLKKQKSTSDLDVLGGGSGGKSKGGSSGGGQQQDSDLPIVPFTLSPEELDITDPTTVETYTGEWKHDKRNGHGVCDRSDGLKYEGQWHNDMKSGYGVTTFKDGTKEEGKYKNNILIVDSKVKRFFQLGGSNIRQRIDDAVKMALQAQTMALKKAEIADTRAATARDKADQAMTAAIEADRDSQIAYSVARQYSNDSLQQQQMMAGGSGGANNFMFSNSQNNQMMNNLMDQQHQHPFLPQNLNMATSPLQMRRISQNQRNFNPNQQPQFTSNPNQNQFQQQQAFNIQDQQNQAASQNSQQQQQQQMQYLDQVKPFNGRRGSFRIGGSQHSPGGPRSGLGGAGPGSTAAGASNHHQGALNRQTSTDPFSDLFDHYRSGGPGYMGVSGSTGPRSRRPMLGKQTSLDYNHLRQQSVPRHLGGTNYPGANNGNRTRRFRMSSLDHADEANQPNRPSTRMSQESINQQDLMQQQQFRHLVTSGEDPEKLSSIAQQQQQVEDKLYSQQQQQQQVAQQHHQIQNNDPTPTPTSSSYVLPHSSAAGSSYNASNQTPSPSNDLGGAHQSAAGGGYSHQQTGYANQMMQHQQQQFNNNRDVRSLADEQLYLAGHRRRYYGRDDGPLEHGGEYSNYDFAITSEPRPSQRCMRRTASLSRATPLAGSPITAADTTRLRASLMDTRGSLSGLSSATTTMRQHQAATLFQAQQHQPMISISPSGAPDLQHTAMQQPGGGGGGDLSNLLANSNTVGQHITMMNMMNHLTPNTSCNSSLTSGVSSASQLNRKPSLQVRYDPIQMGGLMSREEVAALSHAQREQKRIEFEMAEQRAKRPVLHLYLTLKEFITRHQLILSVLLVNICLMKMFADLIV